MPLTLLEVQIHQLREQLKLCQSPKQIKMLQNAIARLEEKLKEEAAEKSRLKVDADTKESQEQQASTRQLSNKAQQETIASISKEQSVKQEWPIVQELSDGKFIEGVPDQGQHQLSWKVFGEIQSTDEGNFTLTIDKGLHTIPIILGRQARKVLEDVNLPVCRYCSLYPKVTNGEITFAKLNACARMDPEEEQFVAVGYWIADPQTLQIQSDFRTWEERSRNRFHQIPVRDGVRNPRTGLRSLKLERNGLNLVVVGENVEE